MPHAELEVLVKVTGTYVLPAAPPAWPASTATRSEEAPQAVRPAVPDVPDVPDVPAVPDVPEAPDPFLAAVDDVDAFGVREPAACGAAAVELVVAEAQAASSPAAATAMTAVGTMRRPRARGAAVESAGGRAGISLSPHRSRIITMSNHK
jgi:hypothetical protein